MTDYEPSFKAYERLAPLDPSARPVAVTVPWGHVLRMHGLWEAWPEAHLVLDSASQDAETSPKQALGAVNAARAARAAWK